MGGFLLFDGRHHRVAWGGIVGGDMSVFVWRLDILDLLDILRCRIFFLILW